MQLKNKKKITGALASATCALLGAPMVQAAGTDNGWKIDTAYLLYTEKDRVSASEPTVKAQKTFAGDKKLNINLVLDTLTGPSPSGAAPSSTPQTFTSPSGAGTYKAGAGEIPLDDSFHDTRAQAGASWDAPINRLMRYNTGFNVSAEHDYQSVGVNGGISRDFNKKNTTLSANLSLDFDTIKPEGGVPTPLDVMQPTGGGVQRDGGSDNKTVVDVLLGLSQVIDAATIMQFNLGVSQASGYLNDPYKVVSIVDPVTGEPLSVAAGGVVYENRPDTRMKESVYWDTKHHTSWGDTIDVSYRFMMDDWGINSHTVDMRYRWNINDKWYMQPHIRWYTQNEADFYQHDLINGQPMPQEVSADFRLAAFDAITVGAKVGYLFTPDNELNFRLENYQQTGKTSSSDLVGVQKTFDSNPDLSAMIFQVGYSFRF